MSEKRIHVPVSEIQYERLKKLAKIRGVPLSRLASRQLEGLLKMAHKNKEIIYD